MALIICPECGGKISDKANVCIHCGYPLRMEKVTNDDSIEKIRAFNKSVDEIIENAISTKELKWQNIKLPSDNNLFGIW